MRFLLRSRPWRSLLLLSGAAGLIALSSCMDRYPTDPSTLGPLFDHDLSGTLLSGTGSTIVTDGQFTFGHWENADQVSFPVATASGMTTATLRVMNDGTDLFISARTLRPLSGPNQDVFTIQLEKDSAAVVYGVSQGNFFDEDCSSLVDDYPANCNSGFESGGAGQRLGSGGVTTYETRIPLEVLGLGAEDIVNVRVIFTPGGNTATTVWPAAGWSQIRIADFEGEDDDFFDDPNRPNVTVIVQDEHCAVSVVLRSEVEYRLQLASEPFGDGQCKTTFFNLEPGSSPVISALNAVLTHPGQRELWPTSEPIPHIAAPRQREGAVFVPTPTALVFGEGTSERLIPPNYYLAFERRKALPTAEEMADPNFDGEKNPTITLALQYGFAKSVSILGLNPGAQVFAVLPYDPDKVFPSFAQGTPGGGVFANKTSSPATMIVGFDPNTDDHETVFTAVDNGNVYSNTWDGGDEVKLYPSPSCYNSEYVVDPWGDGHPDGGLLTYCTTKDAFGNQTNTFVANLKVRGLVSNKKGSFSRWELQLIYINPATSLEETIKALVHCDAGSSCTLQEVHPKRGRVITTGVDVDFGAVDANGNGYVQVPVDFTGITQARLRWRSADNDAGNDFVPNDGLTDLPKNIENGYAKWTRPNGDSPSWSVRL